MPIKPITPEQIMAYPGGATPEQARRLAATYNEQVAGGTVVFFNGMAIYSR